MLTKESANKSLTLLDRVASLILENSAKWGIPPKVASSIVADIDLAADTLEIGVYGQESFEARQAAQVGKTAKVIQHDADEPYMQAFENPMKPHLTNADEPYMQAYADDQSSAMRDGKASDGRPLAPLGRHK